MYSIRDHFIPHGYTLDRNIAYRSIAKKEFEGEENEIPEDADEELVGVIEAANREIKSCIDCRIRKSHIVTKKALNALIDWNYTQTSEGIKEIIPIEGHTLHDENLIILGALRVMMSDSMDPALNHFKNSARRTIPYRNNH